MSTKQRRHITIIKVAAFFLGIASVVFAHEGFDHVTGSVVKVANNVLTVKTAKGNEDVKLDAKTEISKGNAKAAVTDLVPGARVVVEVPEESKDKVANSVKIGTAAAKK